MTKALSFALAALCIIGLSERAYACEVCEAQERPDDPFSDRTGRGGTLFFASTLGAGLAFPDDEQFEPGPTLGAVWEVTFGWGLTDQLALGVDFGTWQNSFLGLPFHFHNAFAPRLEWSPSGADGLVLSFAAGLGTTDGVRPPNSTHHGVAFTPRVAYRWDLGRGAAFSLVGGAHHHHYVDAPGKPLVPFVVGELRFYGVTREK